jgi:hypothetical protein
MIIIRIKTLLREVYIMKIGNNIGYVILENDAPENPSDLKMVIKKPVNNKVVCEAILQTAEQRNRNGRWYAREELFREIKSPRTIELLHARALRGELGHPLSKELARQSVIDDSRTCVIYNKIWADGMNIMGEYTTTNNEFGRTLNQDILEGYIPAFSLRALGSVKTTKNGIEVVNMRMITYDQVIYPSHSNAYTTRILSENADVITEGAISIGYEKDPNETPNSLTESRIIPLTNDDVRKMISADSKNIKFVKECMDFAYDSVVLSENGARVILTTNEGAKMVVNLERYVKNEIMDYCSKF